VPLLEIVDGIRIKVYNRDHQPAHIHAMYNEYEVVIAIIDGKVLSGYLPASQLRKVRSWLHDHREPVHRIFNELNAGIK
jgi:hypothetical protein